MTDPTYVPELTPTRMEWKRDGYTIWADEDGVQLRVARDGFEQAEAVAMFELYQAVLEGYRADVAFRRPTVPPRDAARAYGSDYLAKRLKRAIDAEIVPF